MGRQVASSEFFDAWLTHGRWDRTVALLRNDASRDTLARRFKQHLDATRSKQTLQVVALGRFHERFFPEPPATLLHLPHPLDPDFAWARHHAGPHSFALSGITHTISTRTIMDRFASLVTGPFEPYDTLFCISEASLAVIRAVTGNYADWLRERHGGEPRVRARLERVPLGIDPEKFHPATPDERAAIRAELGIAPDTVVVLYLGRLTYSGKVHPFPMFRAVSEAAQQTGKKVHLLLVGWAEDDRITEHFRQGAQVLAPNITTTILDGTRPEHRFRVWHAADLFTSLTDNVQETLSQTILEAQACGLPVVVTDWDGCRDEVGAEETGFLIPTAMVRGATRDGTSRHLVGETTYAELLADTNQTVSVDVAAATRAFARLIADAGLRARMGRAARQRMLDRFTWESAVRAYERVWAEQDALRLEMARTAVPVVVKTPVPFPDMEFSFASYPAEILGEEVQVVAAPDAAVRLEQALLLPICNYRAAERVTDRVVLGALVAAAVGEGRTLGELDALLARAGVAQPRRRATLAWMLKYDVLRRGP